MNIILVSKSMLDYFGSIFKQKQEIYCEIISRFSDYNSDYITSKLDELYDSNYINEEISVSGWNCFVGKDVCSQINKSIQRDIHTCQLRLLMTKCLHQRTDCNQDIMGLISTFL
jgi:hypothetical protein